MIHKDLDVWKNSIELVVKIYKLTENFPKKEIYCITDQIRRSAISVPSNISEGAARNSSQDFKRFLSISLGSLSELETQLIISNMLDYLSKSEFDDVDKLISLVRSQILNLIKSIKKKMSEELKLKSDG